DLVAGGLHGHQLQRHIRMERLDALHHQLRLNDSQLALPAAHPYGLHSNPSSTARMALAARAVRAWSSPRPATPATMLSPAHTAGKKKVHSSGASATLTGIPRARASSPTARLTERSSVAATAMAAPARSPGV